MPRISGTRPRKNGGRVDYKKLLDRMTEKDRYVDPIINLMADPVTDQSRFIEHLHGFGYTTRMKMMYRLGARARNTNWDEEMIEEARAAGKRTEIFCFKSDISQKLTDSADAVNFLDQDILMAPTPEGTAFSGSCLSGLVGLVGPVLMAFVLK